jgi:hypothetical protein
MPMAAATFVAHDPKFGISSDFEPPLRPITPIKPTNQTEDRLIGIPHQTAGYLNSSKPLRSKNLNRFGAIGILGWPAPAQNTDPSIRQAASSGRVRSVWLATQFSDPLR